MKTQIFILLAVVSILVCNVQADLIWNSGHHEFSEGNEGFIHMYNDASADISGGWIGEFYMYNETVANVTGGEIQVLLGQDTSSVSVYDGSTIGLLRPNDTSTAYVHGGTINHLFALGDSITNIYAGNFPMGFSANDSAIINMYVQTHIWNSDGGSNSEFGLLTGTWLNSGEAFSIDYVDLDAIDHIAFIPEPSMILLVGLGGLMLRAKK